MEDIKSFQRGIDDALEKLRDMARSIEETRDRNKDEDDEDEASRVRQCRVGSASSSPRARLTTDVSQLLKELDSTYLRMLDEREILQIRYDIMDSISDQLKAKRYIVRPEMQGLRRLR